jgi:hypothetical protein
LAALPYPVQAQYPAPGYGYGYGYNYGYPAMPAYSYGWQAAPAYSYYYPQYRPYYPQYPSNPQPYYYPAAQYPAAQYPVATYVTQPRTSTPVVATSSTPLVPVASKAGSTVMTATQAPPEAIPAPTVRLKDGPAAVVTVPEGSDYAPMGMTDGSCPVDGHCMKEADGHGKKACFSVFAEGLYWTVHNAGVPFAQAFDGVDPLLSVPRGPVGVVEMPFKAGGRAGIGVALGDCCWLVGTFTYFKDDQTASIATTTPDVLHANLIFPNTINANFTPMTADASYKITLVMGDIDFKCAFVDTECLTLSWLAGARYARLEQSLDAAYIQVLGTTTVDTHLNFDGFGPRTGLDGEYRLHCGAFVYGKGVINLLAGHFSGNYDQRDIFGGLVATSDINVNRIVPVGELELGVGWRGPKGHFSCSAGYYVGGWCNTLTTNSLVRGIQNNDFTTNGNNFRDVLVFDGLVVRVGFTY